ncbi:MAG: DUF481 domain-containing protein [Bdellovibrionales bacterium]|nr:DUF481 domain-containing protein [Bdellovibrionales bacterium]
MNIRLMLLSVVILAQPLLAVAEDCNCDPKEKDPSVWDKSVSLGFNLTEGNSDTSSLNANTKASRDFESNVWLLELDGNYGKSDGGVANVPKKKTKEDITANVDYQRLLSERFYLGFGTKYLYDDIANVDYRYTLKPAVGYYFIKSDDMKFSMDVGPAYIFEKVGGVTDDFLAPRVSDRFEWKLSETAKFFQTAEYLYDISDSDNYKVVGEAGIEAALNSWLSLVVSAKDKYDNIPAAGKERNDFSLISGLAVIL